MHLPIFKRNRFNPLYFKLEAQAVGRLILFAEEFGSVLKEGVYTDPAKREKAQTLSIFF